MLKTLVKWYGFETVALLVGAALVVALPLPAQAPGVKDQSRVPAHSLVVIPVPENYVRDGYTYHGSDDETPFFMDREWFYEGTIQGSA